MRGQAAFDWAMASGVNLIFKAPRQKAWVVERHNELLRSAIHSSEEQLIKEQALYNFEMLLAAVTFMKNAMTHINRSTPY